MPKYHSPCIINLDDLKGAGTHWTCCVSGHKKKNCGTLILLVCITPRSLK